MTKQPLTEYEWLWRGYQYRTQGSNLEVSNDGLNWIRSTNIASAVYAIRELATRLEKEKS